MSEEMRKRQLLDTAKLLLFREDRIKRFEEILARAKTIDNALADFKKLEEKPTNNHDGNGKYFVTKGENELVQKLHSGWSLVQSLNGDKYLLSKT